jgi:hypothetical protein
MKTTNTFLLVLMVSIASAQTIELKDISGFGQNKFKKAPKRVYLMQFRVNFQLLYSQTETVEAGRTFGGGYRGEAKAGLTMAIKGLESADLQEITDKLYIDFTSQLKNAGFELISADEAASKSKVLSEWERKTGGQLNEAQFPGYITATPSGFEYFVKKTNEDGKEKTGFMDKSMNVSNDIGAVAIKVNLTIPFVENAGSEMGGALAKLGGTAKIVLRPYLRIEKDAVAVASTFSTDAAQTKVTYAFKEGLGTQAISNLALKKNIDLPGIFEDKKYKAVESAGRDDWGTQVGALTIFSVSPRYLENTQPLPCDAKLYKEKVGGAAGAYLSSTINEFLSNVK